MSMILLKCGGEGESAEREGVAVEQLGPLGTIWSRLYNRYTVYDRFSL